MRLFTLAAAQNDARDRNGNTFGAQTATTVVPAGATIQLSYTVPALRGAVIERIHLQVTPFATIANGSVVWVYVTIIPNGAGGHTPDQITLRTQEGPGTFDLRIPGPITLYAGDQLRLLREGAGAPPSCEFDFGYHGVEFDA